MLATYSMNSSICRKENCREDFVVEIYWPFKNRADGKTKVAARRDIIDDLELFYNSKRRLESVMAVELTFFEGGGEAKECFRRFYKLKLRVLSFRMGKYGDKIGSISHGCELWTTYA